jgi:hypothetical protein
MTVYQVAGTTLTLDGDGGTGNIDLADTINPVTGGIGLSTVKFLNAATGNATLTWTPHDVTYQFDDPAYTTTSAEGVDAVFNVLSTYFGYEVELVDGGKDFAPTDVIGVLGTDLGGTTTANDLLITVLTVKSETINGVLVEGIIDTYSIAGTELWPQSTISSVIVLPGTETFIQVTVKPANGSYFTCDTNDTGSVYATPIARVGA